MAPLYTHRLIMCAVVEIANNPKVTPTEHVVVKDGSSSSS